MSKALSARFLDDMGSTLSTLLHYFFIVFYLELNIANAPEGSVSSKLRYLKDYFPSVCLPCF